MSRPYFIHIPKDVLYTDQCQEILQKNPNIDLYKENIVYPKRVDRFMLTFDYWMEQFHPIEKDLTNYIESYKKTYHHTFNSNYIYNIYMKQYMKDRFNACMSYASGGGYYGYTYNVYIDDNYEYAYFYTINIYKSKRAKRDFDGEKAFFINVYKIPYSVFKLYLYQDKYDARFIQWPRGFEFTCDSNKKWIRLRRRNKYGKST